MRFRTRENRERIKKKRERERGEKEKAGIRLIASFRNGMVVSRFGSNFHEETNFLAFGWDKEGKVRRAGPI